MLKDERGITFVAVIIIILVLLVVSLITINVAVNQNEKNNSINTIYGQNETQEIDDNKSQEDIGKAWTEAGETTSNETNETQ